MRRSIGETMRLGLDPREEIKKRAKKAAADAVTIGELWDAHRATPRWQKLRQGTSEIYDLAWRKCLIEMSGMVARDVQLKDVLTATLAGWQSEDMRCRGSR